MQLRRYPGSEAVLFKSEITENSTQKDQVKQKSLKVDAVKILCQRMALVANKNKIRNFHTSCRTNTSFMTKPQRLN